MSKGKISLIILGIVIISSCAGTFIYKNIVCKNTNSNNAEIKQNYKTIENDCNKDTKFIDYEESNSSQINSVKTNVNSKVSKNNLHNNKQNSTLISKTKKINDTNVVKTNERKDALKETPNKTTISKPTKEHAFTFIKASQYINIHYYKGKYNIYSVSKDDYTFSFKLLDPNNSKDQGLGITLFTDDNKKPYVDKNTNEEYYEFISKDLSMIQSGGSGTVDKGRIYENGIIKIN